MAPSTLQPQLNTACGGLVVIVWLQHLCFRGCQFPSPSPLIFFCLSCKYPKYHSFSCLIVMLWSSPSAHRRVKLLNYIIVSLKLYLNVFLCSPYIVFNCLSWEFFLTWPILCWKCSASLWCVLLIFKMTFLLHLLWVLLVESVRWKCTKNDWRRRRDGWEKGSCIALSASAAALILHYGLGAMKSYFGECIDIKEEM